ncbi:hypothetical protein Tco_0957681 [Tanacetum coccineum]
MLKNLQLMDQILKNLDSTHQSQLAKVVALVLLGSFGGGASYIGVFSFVLFVPGDSVAICVYMAAAAPPPPPLTGGDGGDNPQVVLISNLDAGNPLHVHNSDNSSYVLVPFKLLGTKNYRINVYMGLVYSENAADVWKELNETYDKVDGSIVYNFLQKIRYVKQGGSIIANYYHKLNSLWREFDAITKVPKCVCPVKCSCAASTELALHQQLMKLMQFLMGLDDCYQPVMTALLTRDPLPDVKDAYATVSREESHRGIPETPKAIDIKMHATSFAAKSYNQNKRGTNNNFNRYNIRVNGPYNNRGPNPNLTCKNCGFTGHTIERCYALIGYPPGYKKPNAPKQNVFKPNFNANCDTKGSDKQPSACNSPTSFTADQMQKLLNLINDSTSGNTQANMAGIPNFLSRLLPWDGSLTLGQTNTLPPLPFA